MTNACSGTGVEPDTARGSPERGVSLRGRLPHHPATETLTYRLAADVRPDAQTARRRYCDIALLVAERVARVLSPHEGPVAGFIRRGDHHHIRDLGHHLAVSVLGAFQRGVHQIRSLIHHGTFGGEELRGHLGLAAQGE